MSAHVTWTGEPAACTCTRMVVPTLQETLACPGGWRYRGGIGWYHWLPGRPA